MELASRLRPAAETRAVLSDAPERPLRIAHVQLLPILSGVQKVTVEEVLRLDRSLYEPYVICQSSGPMTELLQREGIRCLFAPALVRPISPLHDLVALRQLVGLMRAYRFDIVHTHSSKTGVLGRFAARLSRVPLVLHTVQGFAFPATRSPIRKAIYGAMEWAAARCCDSVIFVNREDEILARRWLGMDPRQAHLVPNGVDLTQFQPLDPQTRRRIRREALGAADGTLVVGTVGRLAPQKNPLCFLEAAHEVLASGVDAKFVMIGDGELRSAVESAARERGWQDRVRVLGWQNNIPELVAALDLFILTSLWEGLPLALLEAMACGIPVVASDIPGNRAVVNDGQNGFLVPAEPARFSERVNALCTDSSMRRRLGEAARRTVEEQFDVEKRFQQVVAIYDIHRHHKNHAGNGHTAAV